MILLCAPPADDTSTTLPMRRAGSARPALDIAERNLLERVRDGNADAFGVLLTRYLEPATRFAYHIVGSLDAADDVVQHVFIEMWNRRANLDPFRPLKPYLFRTIRNHALNERKYEHVRSAYRTRIIGEAEAGTVRATVVSPEGQVLAAATVQAALDALPERRRLAARLWIEDDLSHPAIGEILGISAGAAERLVQRALSDVRDILLGVSGSEGG